MLQLLQLQLTYGDILNLDTEFSSSNASLVFGSDNAVGDTTCYCNTSNKSAFTDYDPEGIRAFGIAGTNIAAFYPQFTRINGSNIEFVVELAAANSATTNTITYQKGPDNLNDRGDFEEGKNNTTSRRS
jgi:hypothetical protein